ncbi:carnitine O-palmitoyltransferase 1, liver isoform-like isoform X2 [Corticium candelabrum]|uniref:carnitine O-palmitoyltransferase 1, liver isoform-like isoform X2 n=1 Tax=Corticium candelabrum TaxID=121492 RepID=UPI002E25706B|nr:carnitine O-palmitoyltransferase 1, liver isoform-like isoform X2 [Corticium candelabrum]
MAEARLAVAFQFAVTDEGVNIHLDKRAALGVLEAAFRSYRRRYYRLRNRLAYGMFPATPLSLLALVLSVLVGCYFQLDPIGFRSHVLAIGDRIPGVRSLKPLFQELIVNLCLALVLWIVFSLSQRYVLRVLLHYHHWIFERRPSVGTKIWGLFITLLSGPFKPMLYSFQPSLPSLPLPSLGDTLSRYLKSVQPLLSDEEFEKMKQLAYDFQHGVGRKLQRYLFLKYLWSVNYVSDWWEQYVYLRSRSPLMINSNYYAVDAMFHCSTEVQAARAASMIHGMMLYKKLLESERLEPLMLRGLIPLCSSQYERTFGTTRIPGIEQDTLRHVDPDECRHIVAVHQGRYYVVPLYSRGRLLSATEIEGQIQRILNDVAPSRPVKNGELKLPSLTAMERGEWGKVYQTFFTSGHNRKAMDMLEKASFIVFLEDEAVTYSKDDPTKLNEMGRSLLHGSGWNRWFDKSVCLVVFKNGRMGFNIEHSWADSPVIGQMLETTVAWDFASERFDADGHCAGEATSGPLRFPERLDWDLNEELVDTIERAAEDAAKRTENLQLRIVVHEAFGKKAIKNCKVGPDGFIQMAIQLAFYREYKKFCLTYEASMMRLFRDGRTETVRPVTMQSCTFVEAMCNPETSKEKCRQLLRDACENHQQVARRAMIGEGVDRHLFCLYVVSKALKVDSAFLQQVLGEPWTLSTSQTPHDQTGALKTDEFPTHVSFGGGFGPVADDGYGVSYVVAGDNHIFFHVSSFAKCLHTDCSRFADRICECMAEMLALFKTEEQ